MLNVKIRPRSYYGCHTKKIDDCFIVRIPNCMYYTPFTPEHCAAIHSMHDFLRKYSVYVFTYYIVSTNTVV